MIFIMISDKLNNKFIYLAKFGGKVRVQLTRMRKVDST